ncbi:MAG: hypothetical protein U9O20_02955 [Patescibacteria group bacterium]|nr:hypothetical protein [Patescibacteria group bacterium]
MNWIILAILAYFLLSVESVANKFLITGKVKSWRLYLFYIGLLSLFSLLLAPFGLKWPGLQIFLVSVAAGVIFFGYLAFLFSSLKGSAASRVFVLIGAVSTLVTVILSKMLLDEQFDLQKILGMILLVIGGVLISVKFYKHKLFSGWKKATIAGVLLAFSMIALKYAYDQQNFVSTYVYSRFGITGMTVILLFVPSYRRRVFSLLRKKDKSKQASNFGAVVSVKALAGVATAIREYSISIGSVAIVSALSSVQYLFVFVISMIMAFHYRNAFKENTDKKTVFYKAVGVMSVVMGVLLVML